MNISKVVTGVKDPLSVNIDEKNKTGYKILLIGNPNTGKSTIFNNLTGLRQHTGNWTGKTVESATGEYMYKNTKITVVDLPGTYSLASNSIDEKTAIEYLLRHDCDLTMVVVDATSLERNLILAVQIIEKCFNVLVCLNLMDEAKRKNIVIDADMLSKLLGTPVICTCAADPNENKILKSKIFDLVSKVHINRSLIPKFSKTTDIVNYCNNISTSVVTYTDPKYNEKQHSLDKIITSKRFGVLFSLMLFGFIFFLTIFLSNYPSQLLTAFFSQVNIFINKFFIDMNVNIFVKGIIADGVFKTVFWVVSVMLPPMALFFPLFTILEDFGLLPRIAFVLDYFFNRVNANGKQSLTMCMGFGCNACAVTNCRIIAQKNQRLIAIITNNFVPCNGRFPLIIALSAIFFAGGSYIFHVSKIAIIVLVAIVFSVCITFLITRFLSSTFLKSDSSVFTLEMPPFRKPQIKKIIVRSIFDRTILILGRAVLVAAPAGALIWLLQNISVNGISILSHAAEFIDPFAKFCGLDGYIILAFILGIPANEIVIPILIMLYTRSGTLTELSSLYEIKELLIQNNWTWLTALLTIVFSLNHFPCATTLLTIKKETRSSLWTLASFVIPTVVGLLCCIVINWIARFLDLAF